MVALDIGLIQQIGETGVAQGTLVRLVYPLVLVSPSSHSRLLGNCSAHLHYHLFQARGKRNYHLVPCRSSNMALCYSVRGYWCGNSDQRG